MKVVIYAAMLTAMAASNARVHAQTPARATCDARTAMTSVRAEVDALHEQMIAAGKSDPKQVARFYTDDATLFSPRSIDRGREAVDKTWAQFPLLATWTLEVVELGGSCDSVWLHGRSTIGSASGMKQTTEYMSVLKRDAQGRLRYYIDMYVPAR